MSEHLTYMTVEDRPTSDPQDAVLWGGVSIEELRDGRLPPLEFPGVRIYSPGEWTEKFRRTFSDVAKNLMRALRQRADDEVLFDVARSDQVVLVESGPGRYLVQPTSAPKLRQSLEAYQTFHHHIAAQIHEDIHHDIDAAIRNDRDALRAHAARTARVRAEELTQKNFSAFFVIQLNTAFHTHAKAQRVDELRKLLERIDVTITGATGGIQLSATDPTVRVTDSPAQQRTDAQRNAFMARGWPTGAQVAERLGSDAVTNTAQFASRLRKEKKLFGVWSTQDGGTYIHPDFQFVDAHTLSPHVPALLEALEGIPGFSDDPSDVKGGDPRRWRRLFWLYEPRAELSEQSLAAKAAMRRGISALDALVAAKDASEVARAPAEVFIDNPDAVIELARMDAQDDRGDI